MKNLRRIKRLFLLLFTIVCCASCEHHSQNATNNEGGQDRKNSKRNFRLISDTDVVCGYPVDDYCCDTAVYRDGIYGFCCHGCKHEFELHPIKYTRKLN
ncbi:MAG: YHS domain-containing protein [Bacteroidetes bacterium]|nr:YHS domain-containing protein [Bacteroidota bacterium]